MSLPQRRETMLGTSISFFNEIATEKINYDWDLFLIMASKKITLWKNTTSRDKTQSWIPRYLHWMEDTNSGRTPCRGPR
jgi:hypothetical protein